MSSGVIASGKLVMMASSLRGRSAAGFEGDNEEGVGGGESGLGDWRM